MKRKIFISYSHRDMEYAYAIHRQLKAYGVDETMIFLDRAKKGVDAGEEWEERIEDEIFYAGVVLFLVSPNFLTSTFIMTKEMPKILETHEPNSPRRVKIYWVKLSEITVPKELKPFQGFCNGSPLSTLGESDKQKAIDDIAKTLSSGYNVDATTREEIHIRIKSIARKKFRLRLGRPRERGINSNSYNGYDLGKTEHVKARYVKSIDQSSDVTNAMLEERLKILKKLDHYAFIKVINGTVEDNLQLLVTEHLLSKKTIRQQIKDARKEKKHLSIDNVRLGLTSLAGALACYHESELSMGTLHQETS